VPCKLKSEVLGFERLYINLNDPILNLTRNATGKSFLQNCSLSPEDVWNLITREALNQGFVLGIRFSEPSLFDLQSNTLNTPTKNKICSTP